MADTDYVSLAVLKAEIDLRGSGDDEALQFILDTAAAAIDRHCRREQEGFVALGTAVARTYTGSGAAAQRIDECTAVTLVEVKDTPASSTYTAWAATDWIAFAGGAENPNFNPIAQLEPFTAIMVDPTGTQNNFLSGRYVGRSGFRPMPVPRARGVPTVRVTANWGYATVVPPTIARATLITAGRWYKRAQVSWGDTVASPEMGDVFMTKSLDPDVRALLHEGGFVGISI